MPVPIIMPKFGFTLESCQILEWVAEVGDTLREGDPIAEVETDKVNMEVEATADGTLLAILYEVGDDVPVTEVIAYLQMPGEEVPDDWQPPEGAANPASTMQPPAEPAGQDSPAETDFAATPVARRMAEERDIDLSAVQGTGPRGKITKQDITAAATNGREDRRTQPVPQVGGKVPATPAARRIAAELGVDLAQVRGTGPDRRVQGFDVQAFFESGGQPAAVPEPQAPVESPRSAPQAIEPLDEDAPTITPIKGMRKTIARRLQASFRDAPHIFMDTTVDMSGILDMRNRFKSIDKGVSVTSIIVKACAAALMDHPVMNSTFDGENISQWPHANVGVAVALDNGLVVPVIHRADTLSLREIQEAVADLASRARDGKLKPQDVQNGTFSVSNLGMYGVDRFTAVINPPQVGILAVGRTVESFVPDADGNPVLRSMMSITVSADHRVVDGAQAAQFIGDLRAILEEPVLLAW